MTSSVTTRHHSGEKSLQNGGVPYAPSRGRIGAGRPGVDALGESFEA